METPLTLLLSSSDPFPFYWLADSLSNVNVLFCCPVNAAHMQTLLLPWRVLILRDANNVLIVSLFLFHTFIPHSHTQGEIVKSRSSTKVSGSKTPTTSQGVYPFTAISISQSIADQQAPKRDAFGDTGAGIQILDQDIAPVLRNRAQVSSGQTRVPQEGTSDSSAATGGLNRFSNLRNSFSNYYSSGRRRKKISASVRVRQSRRKEAEAIPFQLNSVSQIDKFSRVFFPVTFMVINYIYWSYYLKDEEYVSDIWNR